MSTLRLTFCAALAGAVLATAPTAFAQRAEATKEMMRATEGMKSDAMTNNAQEVVKEQNKAMSDKSKDADKAMKDKMDKDKKMGMEKMDQMHDAK